MIGILDMVVIDCPEPRVLAEFYAEVFGVKVLFADDGWAEIDSQVGPRPLMAFQKVENYTAPKWPTQDLPQQMHLDVKVDDFDVAEAAVLAIGATETGAGTETYRVYLDPAGHPFCLIKPND